MLDHRWTQPEHKEHRVHDGVWHPWKKWSV